MASCSLRLWVEMLLTDVIYRVPYLDFDMLHENGKFQRQHPLAFGGFRAYVNKVNDGKRGDSAINMGMCKNGGGPPKPSKEPAPVSNQYAANAFFFLRAGASRGAD